MLPWKANYYIDNSINITSTLNRATSKENKTEALHEIWTEYRKYMIYNFWSYIGYIHHILFSLLFLCVTGETRESTHSCLVSDYEFVKFTMMYVAIEILKLTKRGTSW